MVKEPRRPSMKKSSSAAWSTEKFNRIAVPFLLFIAFVALPGVSSADPEKPFYAEFRAGVSVIPDIDVSGGGLSADAEFDPGFAVGGAIGWYAFPTIPSLRTEIDLSYREADVDKIGPLDGAGEVSVFSAMVNVIYDIDLDSPVTPYIGVGIGLGLADVDSDNGALLDINDDSLEFAWNVLLGAAFQLNDSVSLTAGYKYLGITDPEFDATAGGASGTLDAEDVQSHEFLLGLRYGF
jgi:OOP family OmpA-OmpF porin